MSKSAWWYIEYYFPRRAWEEELLKLRQCDSVTVQTVIARSGLDPMHGKPCVFIAVQFSSPVCRSFVCENYIDSSMIVKIENTDAAVAEKIGQVLSRSMDDELGDVQNRGAYVPGSVDIEKYIKEEEFEMRKVLCFNYMCI